MKTLANPQVQQDVLNRIAQLQATDHARWGRMSCQQMLCHLNDSFRLAMGERAASPAMNLLSRTLVKWVALYAPIHWPKGLPTRPEIEQGAGGSPPTEWYRDRDELVTLIERFSTPQRDFAGLQHPMFGGMPDREWLRWGYLHADHHLRQFGA